MDFSLPLNLEEARMLKKAVAFFINNVHTEIAKTDDHDYRAALKAELDSLQKLDDKLSDIQDAPRGAA